MIKILIQIKDNVIYFKTKRKINEDQQNILNTNIISDNELVFSDEYIYSNIKMVTKFINELVCESNIDTAVIYNNKVVNEILDILANIKSITTLSLKDDLPLTFKMCEKISKTNIKSLSCFTLYDFMVEFFDKYNIIVETRSELLFNSKFMETNNFKKYSSLFYSRSINLSLPMNIEDYDDFETFLKTNKYLKVIHIDKTIKSDLENIIDILKKFKKKNIKIIIHENIHNIEIVNYIKKVNKYSKKYNNIKISISYSDDYLAKNFFPQANINILKVCLVLIICLVTGSFIYVIVSNYNAGNKDEDIKNDLQEVIDTADTEELVEELEKESEKTIVNEYIASIMTLNKDAVGWIRVNNTKIDYPILKGSDNSYYLTHNIKHKDDLSGWIYMDYRNDKELRDDNTIIYGHTRFNSGVMFGTLSKIKTEEWRNVEENLIIEVDHLYESGKYKIFSYYTIEATNDYITPNFVDDLEKLEFYRMIEQRSEFDFGIKLESSDNIITLSTCDNGDTHRLVVHAYKIN